MTDSSNNQFCPFEIEPRFVGRIWGYRDLSPWYEIEAGDEPIGEVWLTGDDCRIASGPHAGKTLISIFNDFPAEMLGQAAPRTESPLLVKTIFAREKLSVQVHPDDAMAQKYGDPRGKTECWYALSAEPGAEVACGLKPGVTLEQVEAGIQDGTLEDSLAKLPIAQGDMVFVDAGTVHAILPGSILLEVQQNCDITYRMFDYGRPRELHVERSLEATKLITLAGKIAPQPLDDRTVLIDVEYFRVERLPVRRPLTGDELAGGATPGLSYLFVVNGSARIHSAGCEAVQIPTRGIACVPAAAPAFELEPLGQLELIRISPRWPSNK